MRIVHLSDIHAVKPPDSVSAFFDKRMLGTLNHLLRRGFLHDHSLLHRLVNFVLDLKPDLLVVTGDITSTGQPAEFAAALDALRPLVDSPEIETIYVPGNHDAYVSDKRCVASLAEAFSVLNAGATELDSLPFVRTIGDLDFILVNEARPTNIFLSSGKVEDAAAARISEICAAPKTRPRLLVGHFPVRQRLSWRRSLVNRGPLSQLLDAGSVDLSLCGHTHEPEIDVDGGGRGEVVAGSFTRTSDVNVIDYDSERNVFNVESVVLER